MQSCQYFHTGKFISLNWREINDLKEQHFLFENTGIQEAGDLATVTMYYILFEILNLVHYFNTFYNCNKHNET